MVYAVTSTVVLLVLGGLNGFASRAYADACIWLAISRRLPWRAMSFLVDAERRGIFQEVGAIYRFRHIRVQLELRGWHERNRFRLRDWRPRLQRLLDQFSMDPVLARLQSKANSYRKLARQNLAGFGVDLTLVLGDLAATLRNLGRPAEELEVRGEIVATLRTMTTANPGMSLRLAEALERYAHCLAESGREYEAFGVMSEAADIYRWQAAPQRKAFQSRLVDWLDQFSFQVRRRTLTRSLMTEVNRVTDIYRDLVLTEPGSDTAAHARALIRLARALRWRGRHSEAAAALDDAARVYRGLILASAGGTKARAHEIRAQAQGLVKVANAFELLELPDKAADAITGAVQVYRKLAQAEPDTYRVRLAGLLTRLANLSRELDRSRELDAIREAVRVYRDAADDNGVHCGLGSRQADAEQAGTGTPFASADTGESDRLSLASLSDLSIRLWKLGERDAALDAAQTGRRLAAANGAGNLAPTMSWEPITDHDPPPQQPGPRASVRPGETEWPRDIKFVNHSRKLADEFDTRAFRFLVSGQIHESLAASIDAVRCGQQAVEIQRELASTWPSAYLGDLAETLELLAGYLRKVGSREHEAEDAAREAHEIRRRLQGPSP